jgi:hypothetical protein
MGPGARLATATIVHRFHFGRAHLPRSASILSLISNTGVREDFAKFYEQQQVPNKMRPNPSDNVLAAASQLHLCTVSYIQAHAAPF